MERFFFQVHAGLAHGLIDLGAVAPFVRRQRHHRIIDRGINRRLVINGLVRPFPPQIERVFFVVHDISRFSFRFSPMMIPCALNQTPERGHGSMPA